MKPRYTVKVTMQQLQAVDVVLVVTDKADMLRQIEAKRVEIRTHDLPAKPERDKAGEVVMHQLNKDWDVPE